MHKVSKSLKLDVCLWKRMFSKFIAGVCQTHSNKQVEGLKDCRKMWLNQGAYPPERNLSLGFVRLQPANDVLPQIQTPHLPTKMRYQKTRQSVHLFIWYSPTYMQVLLPTESKIHPPSMGYKSAALNMYCKFDIQREEGKNTWLLTCQFPKTHCPASLRRTRAALGFFFGCGVATFRCPAEVVSPQNVNVDGDGDGERRTCVNWNILVEPWISFH